MNESSGWQLGNRAPETYERYLVPGIFAPWAQLLTALAGLLPGQRVLDVACGTGIVARLAAQQVVPAGQVTGVDVNSGMLDIARSSFPTASATLEWREANACELPFEDEAFDVAFCQLGLMYFPDRVKALSEMRRVLRPHGRLIILVWRSIAHSPGFAAIAEALDRHVNPEAAAIMRAPFAFGDALTELRRLFDGARFTEARVHSDVRMVRFASSEELVRRQVAGSPLAGHLAQAKDEARAALIRDVSNAMQGYENDAGVSFPIEGHIAVARP